MEEDFKMIEEIEDEITDEYIATLEKTEEELKKIEEEEEEINELLYLLLIGLYASYKWDKKEVSFGEINGKKIMDGILGIFEELAKLESKVLGSVLNRAADNSYNRHSDLLSRNFDLKVVGDKKTRKIIEEIVGMPIMGLTASERAGSNRASKLLNIKGAIIDGIIKGQDVDSLIKDIYRVTKSGTDGFKMLTRTEVARVWNQAQAKVYKDAGVKHVRFSAKIDGKTSKTCRSLHGNIYKLAEIGDKQPPLHPNCRSNLVPVYYK